MLSKRIIPAAIVAAAALSVAPAAGAITWTARVTVSAAGEQAYIGPRVATDANGDMIVAWLKVSSVSGGGWQCPCVVRAAYRPAGGSFGAPVDVSPSMPTDDSAQQIFLAMSAGGDAIVGWNGGAHPNSPGIYDIPYAAIRPAGGSFAQAAPLVDGDNSGLGADLDGLTIDAAGDAIALIGNEQQYTGANGPGDVYDTQLVLRPADGVFDTAHPQTFGDGVHDAFARAIAMSPNGKAVLAMRVDGVDLADPSGNVTNAVEVTTSSAPGAAFDSTPTTLESISDHPQSGGVYPVIDTGSISAQNVAIDDAGDYVVGYTRSDAILGDPNQADDIVKVSLNGGSGVTLSQPSQTFSGNGPVTIDSTGQAVMLWSDGNGNEMESVRPPGQGFGASVATGLPIASSLANAVNEEGANGQILYLFDAAGANGGDVDASIGTAAGSFPAATTLATDDDFLAFGTSGAIDKNGDAAATWLGGSTNQYEVHVAVASNGSNPPPPTTHTLTVTKSGSGSGTVTSSPAGISCGSACSHAFNAGTAVTLTATAAAGSTFAGWSGGGCSGGGVCKVTLSGDATVTATFHTGSGQQGAPDTKITSREINKKKHTAKFAFKAVGTATGFKCALVKAPKKGHRAPKARFAGCKSPKTYKHLKRGHYVFEVRAVNAAGTDPTPAKAKFKL